MVRAEGGGGVEGWKEGEREKGREGGDSDINNVFFLSRDCNVKKVALGASYCKDLGGERGCTRYRLGAGGGSELLLLL